jgi:nucleoside-diphosphate-sugar epimerase
MNKSDSQQADTFSKALEYPAIRSNSPVRRVLITGASGAVGCAVANRFWQGGCRLRILDQLPFPIKYLDAQPEFLQGDITDSSLLSQAVKDVDLVVHMAAKLHINNPDPSLRAEYQRVNVEGTKRLVAAASEAKVPRFVFFSTICVYGPCSPPAILDENSPINPDSWYAETKYQAEQFVLQNIPAVVLRPAAIYGPRMKGNYLRLLRALHKGFFVGIGSGANRRTLIFDEDLAEAVYVSGTHTEGIGRIYNATDGQIHSFQSIVESMCQALGRKPLRWRLPLAPVKAGAKLAEIGFSLIGRRSPITCSIVDKVVEDVAVSGTRLERELSFCPRVSLLTGWQNVVRAVFPEHDSMKSAS